MANNENHSIQRFTFDVDITDRDKAYSIQNELSRIFNGRLIKVIDSVCDEMQVQDHLLRIREMELDIGLIVEYDLEDDLVYKFERAFREALQKLKLDASYKSNSYDRNSELVALIPARQEMVAYFLQYGRLPSAASTFPDSIDKIFEDLIQQDPEAIRETILELAPRAPYILRRIAERFDTNIQDSIFRLLSPDYFESISRSIYTYAREIAQQSILPLSRAQALLAEASLRFLIQNYYVPFSYSQYLQAVRRQAEQRTDTTLEEVFPPESSEDFLEASTELNQRFANELNVIREIMRGNPSPEARSQILMAWDTLVRQHVVGLRAEIRRNLETPTPLFRLIEALPSERIYAFLAEVIPNRYRELVRLIVRVISVHSRYVQGFEADRALRVLLYGHLVRYALEADNQRLNVTSFAAYLKRSLQNVRSLPDQFLEDWEETVTGQPSARRRREREEEQRRREEEAAEEERREEIERQQAEEEEAEAVRREEEEEQAREEAEEITAEEEARREAEEAEREKAEQEAEEAKSEEDQAEETSDEKVKEEGEKTEEEQALEEEGTEEKEEVEGKEKSSEEEEAEEKAREAEEKQAEEEQKKAEEEQKQAEEEQQAKEEQEKREAEERAEEEQKAELEREEEEARAKAEEEEDTWEPVEDEGDPEVPDEPELEAEEEQLQEEFEDLEPEDLLDPEQAQIDLILYVLKEGSVPWWAKNLRTPSPAEALQELIDRKSSQLVPVIQQLVKDTAVQNRPDLALRLIKEFGNEAISALLGELVPGFSGFMETVAMALESYVNRNVTIPRQDQFAGPAEFKWFYVLRYYFDYQDNPVDVNELLNYVVAMVAAGSGRSQASVAKDLREVASAANRSGNSRFFPLETSLPANMAEEDSLSVKSPQARESIALEAAYHAALKRREDAARRRRQGLDPEAENPDPTSETSTSEESTAEESPSEETPTEGVSETETTAEDPGKDPAAPEITEEPVDPTSSDEEKPGDIDPETDEKAAEAGEIEGSESAEEDALISDETSDETKQEVTAESKEEDSQAEEKSELESPEEAQEEQESQEETSDSSEVEPSAEDDEVQPEMEGEEAEELAPDAPIEAAEEQAETAEADQEVADGEEIEDRSDEEAEEATELDENIAEAQRLEAERKAREEQDEEQIEAGEQEVEEQEPGEETIEGGAEESTTSEDAKVEGTQGPELTQDEDAIASPDPKDQTAEPRDEQVSPTGEESGSEEASSGTEPDAEREASPEGESAAPTEEASPTELPVDEAELTPEELEEVQRRILEEAEKAAEQALADRLRQYEDQFAELQEASQLNEEEDSEGSEGRPIKLGDDGPTEEKPAAEAAKEEETFDVESIGEEEDLVVPEGAKDLEVPEEEIVSYFLESGSLPTVVGTMDEESVLYLVRTVARQQPRIIVEALRKAARSRSSTERIARLPLPTVLAILRTLLPPAQQRQYLSYITELERLLRRSSTRGRVDIVLTHALAFFGRPDPNVQQSERYLDSLVRYIARELTLKPLEIIDWLLEISRGQSNAMTSSFREILQMLRVEVEAPRDVLEEDPEETPEEIERPIEEEEEDPTIYIDNAGLAIVFAILPSVFKSLGYTNDNDEFFATDAKVRAAHFLAYLSHAKENSPEEELVLNKILVGIPQKESILKEVPMSDKEKEIADEVLQELLEGWPGMKNTSPATFRKSWFMRKGKLLPGETEKESWILRVDQESYDMLLGRLPWPYNKFEAPWTDETIRVEWA